MHFVQCEIFDVEHWNITQNVQYLSVFGSETIESDERSNRYFGHILVNSFCQENVGSSI